ncbi:hypothetical protein [Sporosarcina sp.]|uniref:hypothetical protein n=1 Tax=Sporosarcina sp. TaxID=49982 RepID=UPI00262DEFF2|nr:hypothetical protein [Sporosarcina sp.]
MARVEQSHGCSHVALALNVPIITRCKDRETASRFLDRLRQAVIPNEAKFKTYMLKGRECIRIPFYHEHFFDFFRHTPKQVDRLLGLCHLRSTIGNERGRFCLPRSYPCFTSKSKDRQNFLLKTLRYKNF